VKARKVKGLDPDGTLADNVERIVRVRLDELDAFMPRAEDPDEVQALHDMRIAAKRLRYILELHHANFGPYAAAAARRAKEIQSVIGEIHDCDVTIPRVEELLDELRRADVAAIRARATGEDDVEPALAAAAPNAEAYRGLEAMRSYLQARREVLFEAFLELWLDLQREGFRPRLEFALGERPTRITPSSQDGNVAGEATDLPSLVP
jgi:CHAD domain-containing protein